MFEYTSNIINLGIRIDIKIQINFTIFKPFFSLAIEKNINTSFSMFYFAMIQVIFMYALPTTIDCLASQKSCPHHMATGIVNGAGSK